MSDAPEKIWVDADFDAYDYQEQETTPYIRADLVDELAQALKWIMAILPIETETDLKAIDRAKVALAKARGEG